MEASSLALVSDGTDARAPEAWAGADTGDSLMRGMPRSATVHRHSTG